VRRARRPSLELAETAAARAKTLADPTRGLVRSRRDGKMVMYALTDDGRALVDVVLGTVPVA
jgi:hypothetical protein